MAGTGLLIFGGKSTENVLVKYLTKDMPCVFCKFHICFVLSVLKKNNHIPHTFGGVKSLKHNVRTTLRFSGGSRISKVGGHFGPKKK